MIADLPLPQVVIKLPTSISIDHADPFETTIMPNTDLSDYVCSLLGLRAAEIQAANTELVLQHVNQVVADTAVSADDALMESGIDSLAATELANSLQRELGEGIKLPSTLIFDHPSATEVARLITQQMEAISSQQMVTADVSGFMAILRDLSVTEAQQMAQAMVLQHVNQVVAGAAVSADDALMESGVDSLAATELANSLQRELGEGIELPSTLVTHRFDTILDTDQCLSQVFDFPSAASLAEYLVQESCVKFGETHSAELFGETPPGVNTTAEEYMSSNGRVAIAALGCSAPGEGCQTADRWWHQLTTASDSLTEIPRQRFDVGLVVTCKSHHGHFVQNAEQFDHVLFGVSSNEARMTDPSQRVLLRSVLDVTTKAQHTRKSLVGASMGVFLGASGGGWSHVQQDKRQPASVFSVHGSDVAAAAGRVSYLFGLKGTHRTLHCHTRHCVHI